MIRHYLPLFLFQFAVLLFAGAVGSCAEKGDVFNMKVFLILAIAFSLATIFL